MVIEIADTSLERDRGIKLRSYARAGIPVYLIMNLLQRQVELFTNPDPTAQPYPTYRRPDVFRSGAIALPLPEGAVVQVTVEDMLPPPQG